MRISHLRVPSLDLALDHLGAGDREVIGQARPGLLGHVAHLGEVGDAAMMHPAEDLGGAHLGLAVLDHAALGQGGDHLRAGQARQVDQRLSGIGFRSHARQVEGDAQGAVQKQDISGIEASL
jgi:hypothetical protein